MASHHFIGNGRLSEVLSRAATEPADLASQVAGMVRIAGLEVVDQRSVAFDNGGLTLVWVLAESHLVLHHWSEEGFATLDLHVCDYHGPNQVKAAALVSALTAFCFEPGTESWNEIHLEDPVPASASVSG
jgi:S-adenosylmethionine/arginine decarboxylase-like enzyme